MLHYLKETDCWQQQIDGFRFFGDVNFKRFRGRAKTLLEYYNYETNQGGWPTDWGKRQRVNNSMNYTWDDYNHEQVVVHGKYKYLCERRKMIHTRNSDLISRKLKFPLSKDEKSLYMIRVNKAYINPMLVTFKLEFAARDRDLGMKNDWINAIQNEKRRNIAHLLCEGEINEVVAHMWECCRTAWEKNQLHIKGYPLEDLMLNFPKLGDILHNLRLLFVWGIEWEKHDRFKEYKNTIYTRGWGEGTLFNNIPIEDREYRHSIEDTRGSPVMYIGVHRVMGDYFAKALFECLNIESDTNRYIPFDFHPMTEWYWAITQMGLHTRVPWEAPGSPSEKEWSKIDDPYYFGPNRIWVAAERDTLKQCTIWQNDTGKGKQPSITWKESKTTKKRWIFYYNGISRQEACDVWRFTHRIPVNLYIYKDEFMEQDLWDVSEYQKITYDKIIGTKWTKYERGGCGHMKKKKQGTFLEVYNRVNKASSSSSSSSGSETETETDSSVEQGEIWLSQSMDPSVQEEKNKALMKHVNKVNILKRNHIFEIKTMYDFGIESILMEDELYNEFNKITIELNETLKDDIELYRIRKRRRESELEKIQALIENQELWVEDWRSPNRVVLRRKIQEMGGIEKVIWMTWKSKTSRI